MWDYKLIKVDALVRELLNLNHKILILGDGVPIVKKALAEVPAENIVIASSVFAMPRASSIAAVALEEYAKGNAQDCFSIKPFYIRKSNAEEKRDGDHGAKS